MNRMMNGTFDELDEGRYDWDVSQVQVQVNFALPKLVQYKMAYRISRLTNDESKYTLFFFFL